MLKTALIHKTASLKQWKILHLLPLMFRDLTARYIMCKKSIITSLEEHLSCVSKLLLSWGLEKLLTQDLNACTSMHIQLQIFSSSVAYLQYLLKETKNRSCLIKASLAQEFFLSFLVQIFFLNLCPCLVLYLSFFIMFFCNNHLVKTFFSYDLLFLP